jgi:hypothetical protein
MRPFIYAAWLLIFIGSIANAVTQPTAQSFLQLCVNDDAKCAFYIAGYVQALETAQVQPQGSLTGICFPDNFSAGEAEAVFIRFMRTHGEDPFVRDNPPENAIWLALSIEYPCKKS